MLRMFARFDPRPLEIADALRAIVALAAVAWLVGRRAPLLRSMVAIVTMTVLAILLLFVPLLVVIPFGVHWLPPSWNDARHLHPLQAANLCRGVTLFDPKIHGFAYASILRITRNFRGEHRPMILLEREFAEGREWLPAEVLTRLLVDDRDPALRTCEPPERHPTRPKAGESVRDRLPF